MTRKQKASDVIVECEGNVLPWHILSAIQRLERWIGQAPCPITWQAPFTIRGDGDVIVGWYDAKAKSFTHATAATR